MSERHTPGPWHIQYIGDECYVESDGEFICDMQFSECELVGKVSDAAVDEVRGKVLANARLIAAAPELLAALEHAHKEIIGTSHKAGSFPGHCYMCTAIAKAKSD